MQTDRWAAWLCRIVGLLRTLGWAAALYLVASPWRELGGLIAERLRWFGWFVLYSGIVLGFALGDFMREARPPENVRENLRLAWRLLCLPAFLTAVWLVVLQSLGLRDAAGVVFTALLAYWAGVDIALGAMPLMEGRLPGEVSAEGAYSQDAGPLPPWES